MVLDKKSSGSLFGFVKQKESLYQALQFIDCMFVYSTTMAWSFFCLPLLISGVGSQLAASHPWNTHAALHHAHRSITSRESLLARRAAQN
jgi:hypothetical protein